MKRIPFILFLFLTVPLWGQRPSGAESRHMNILILNTLDEYIRTSSLSDRDDVRDFEHLFLDPDSPCIYNDIPGTPGYQGVVSPRQYAALVDYTRGSVLRADISQVRKSGDFYREGGVWHRKVTVRKYVMLIDASVYTSSYGGVLFDSDHLYDADRDFHLVLDFVFDAETDRMRIASVQSSERRPSRPVDNDAFTVVVRPDNVYADHLYSGNTPLKFNEFGQAVVENGTLKVDDDDVVLRYNTLGSSSLYTVVEPVFKKYHFRIKPRFSMTMNDAFSFSAVPENVDFVSASKAMEAGLDLGFSMSKMGRSSRLLLYLGAALSRSSVSMETGEFSYRYGTVSPIAYSIRKASEAYAFQEFVFPLYFEWESSLGSRLALSLDFGGKFYLNRNNTVSAPFHVDGSVSVAGAAATSFSTDFDRFIAPASYGKEPYDISAFANLEVDVRLIPAFYLFVSGGYEYGILPAFKSSETPFYRAPSGAGSAILPVVYAGGKHFAYHSFADCITFKRQAVWLSAGLKIKL